VKALIVANGELEEGGWWRTQVADATWIIAADGGASNALRVGLMPQIVIGDLDSLDEELLTHLQAHGSRLMQHSSRKDETDTELALKYAVELGATEIYILGALGGRLDHALANILSLAMPELADAETYIVTRHCVISLIRHEARFEGQVGDILSLLPVGGDVTGITTEGLEYPLHGDTLRFGPARGISNVLTAPVARVRIGGGLLLALKFTGNDSGRSEKA